MLVVNRTIARKFKQAEEIYNKVLKYLMKLHFCDHIKKFSDHKNKFPQFISLCS